MGLASKISLVKIVYQRRLENLQFPVGFLCLWAYFPQPLMFRIKDFCYYRFAVVVPQTFGIVTL